jgi:hypothetical protein
VRFERDGLQAVRPTMTILGTIALIALVILSVMVLRVKSDPMDNKSIRKYLVDFKNSNKPRKP